MSHASIIVSVSHHSTSPVCCSALAGRHCKPVTAAAQPFSNCALLEGRKDHRPFFDQSARIPNVHISVGARAGTHGSDSDQNQRVHSGACPHL